MAGLGYKRDVFRDNSPRQMSNLFVDFDESELRVAVIVLTNLQ